MYILTDGKLDEDHIEEMAKERRAIIQDLSHVRGTVIEHLLKLYYFSFADCANQWKETVWKELKEVPRQKRIQ